MDLQDNRWIYELAEGSDAIYAASTLGLVSIRPDTRETSLMEKTRSGRQAFRNRYFSSAVMDSRGLLWCADDLVVPVLYSDNYFFLMPGESREVAIRLQKEDISGRPVVSVSGFNVDEREFSKK